METKTKLAIVMMGALLGNLSYAKRGERNGEERVRTPARGSSAWFIQESGEYELRALIAKNIIAENSIKSLAVELSDTKTASVTVATLDETIVDTCKMVDHWSRRGTVLKKEVICGNAPFEPRKDLTRGSNGWAVHEAIEYSLRSEILGFNASADSFESVLAEVLQNGKTVLVTLESNSGMSKQYSCIKFKSLSRSGTVLKDDLHCSVK